MHAKPACSSKASRRGSDEAVKNEMLRALNKAALVTMWIEPDARQIVKYTLNDIAPGQKKSFDANGGPLSGPRTAKVKIISVEVVK